MDIPVFFSQALYLSRLFLLGVVAEVGLTQLLMLAEKDVDKLDLVRPPGQVESPRLGGLAEMPVAREVLMPIPMARVVVLVGALVAVVVVAVLLRVEAVAWVAAEVGPVQLVALEVVAELRAAAMAQPQVVAHGQAAHSREAGGDMAVAVLAAGAPAAPVAVAAMAVAVAVVIIRPAEVGAAVTVSHQLGPPRHWAVAELPVA